MLQSRIVGRRSAWRPELKTPQLVNIPGTSVGSVDSVEDGGARPPAGKQLEELPCSTTVAMSSISVSEPLDDHDRSSPVDGGQQWATGCTTASVVPC